jgi:hypothetical protein
MLFVIRAAPPFGEQPGGHRRHADRRDHGERADEHGRLRNDGGIVAYRHLTITSGDRGESPGAMAGLVRARLLGWGMSRQVTGA